MIKKIVLAILLNGALLIPTQAGPLKAGEEGKGPWWMRQTALKRDGSIARFSSQQWWNRAKKLKVGESFIIPAAGEAKDRMLVRKEKFRTSGMVSKLREVEAIVWIIDDDGDGSAMKGGDQANDCYVVDYDCDGTVDRMVDYIDNDGDGVMDELDIRYFDNGRLNWSWFGDDIDHDGVIRKITGYERGNEFEGDPYGDNMFYMNKLNPLEGVWSPISECPFAFYDTDGDGFSETVVRVSAVPMSYDVSRDPDYANTAYLRPWEKAMADVGVLNIRYSFDIDRGSSKDSPLHYDIGFNMLGLQPYRFPGMVRSNPKRRPPQETVVVPWKDLRAVADRYEAKETGFSWNENSDDSVANGADPEKMSGLDDFRWEGVFWMWERRFIGNTGGPCQKWNMRREWRSRPAGKRELYYSGVDRRIHLVGAEEGWIEIGRFSGLGEIGEIRMFDTNRNGFFDRWEVYLEGNPLPVRVTTVQDEQVKLIDFDPEKLTEFYTKEVLPKAMADRRKLTKAMNDWHPFEVPAELKTAMESGSESYRRYAMDVSCELQYQDFRKSLMKQAEDVFEPLRKKPEGSYMGDLLAIKRSPDKQKDLEKTINSHTAWRLVRALAELDDAYGRGDTDGACSAVAEIGRIGLFR